MEAAVSQAVLGAEAELAGAETKEMDLLRFSTAGSVDDGKSTLIGRLLYDSKGVYEDQIASVRQASAKGSAGGALDLALLTDGLRAEREQGITIDVAYRYFSTPKRKFIIADTPGHEQYTRNMATGASTANLAIILVDARYGVLPQSRRHAFIASLLGIQHLVIAVNKMDLVDYAEEPFRRICAEFSDYASRLQVPDLHFIPMSALKGDNVVEKSKAMPWFDGSSLLHYLEHVYIASDRNMTEFRFPVQHVLRPNLDFRGYAGQVASGVIKPGDAIMALPSGRTSRVREIVTYDGPLPEAFPPMSVTVCLEDELDVGRGDMLVPPSHLPHITRKFDARLVWMSDRRMELGKGYLLKHCAQTLRASVTSVRYRININTLEKERDHSLGLNEIGAVVIEAQKPIFCDPYRRNHATGSFILIDPVTNATVAAGMITGREPGSEGQSTAGSPAAGESRVTLAEREARWGHAGAVVWLEAPAAAGQQLERALFERDCLVKAIAAEEFGENLPAVAKALADTGIIALVCGAADSAAEERVREAVGDRFTTLSESALESALASPADARRFLFQWLPRVE